MISENPNGMLRDRGVHLLTWQAEFLELKTTIGETIGGAYVSFKSAGKDTWIEVDCLIVKREFRQMGYGRLLMNKILDKYGRSFAICMMIKSTEPWFKRWICDRLEFQPNSPYHNDEGWVYKRLV